MTIFDYIPDFDGPGYYNTTRLAGADLADAEAKALTQEERIEALFNGMPDGWTASPEDVHRKVGGRSPLTSTRRAMTNLTRRGVLVKTDNQREGQYGRPVYLWKAA